jgi:Protein kinase domain
MPEVVRKLGRYEIVREVGRGGMAVVYLARQTDLDRVVALKELAAFHAADPAFAERFVRESRIAGSMSHPNIVTVHDYLEFEGTPYIAMEYLERGSLRPLVGRMTFAQTAGVLEGVLAGLAHAETRGIVHRDLKPENVMVTAEGAVKIADFGVAKALNQVAHSQVLSVTGMAMGTPAYMAPEQAMSTGIGPWTDLYSTGVIAYELLLGRVPFDQGDTPVAVLMQVVNEPIPPPRELNPDLDPALAHWLERMLAKEPAERPPGAAAAWEELEEVVIALLGPRWRREARLVGRQAANGAPQRLMPAGATTEPRRSDAATRAAAAPPTVKAPATRGRRRFFLIVVLGLLAVAGLAVAILPGRLDESDGREASPTAPATTAAQSPTTTEAPRTTTTTSTTPVATPPRPIANELQISSEGRNVTARILFDGQALKASGLKTSDDEIADGEASFVLWQKGIGTQVGRKTAEGLTLVVDDNPSRLRFDLLAAAGAFETMSVPRIVDGKTIEVILTAPAPPPADTGDSGGGGVGGGTTTTPTVSIG